MGHGRSGGAISRFPCGMFKLVIPPGQQAAALASVRGTVESDSSRWADWPRL